MYLFEILFYPLQNILFLSENEKKKLFINFLRTNSLSGLNNIWKAQILNFESIYKYAINKGTRRQKRTLKNSQINIRIDCVFGSPNTSFLIFPRRRIKNRYIMNHVSTESRTIDHIIPSGTSSQPTVISIQ